MPGLIFIPTTSAASCCGGRRGAPGQVLTIDLGHDPEPLRALCLRPDPEPCVTPSPAMVDGQLSAEEVRRRIIVRARAADRRSGNL